MMQNRTWFGGIVVAALVILAKSVGGGPRPAKCTHHPLCRRLPCVMQGMNGVL